jgi:predicted transcriptional regulator
MATLTIRIPDAHRDRLTALAAQRNLSVSKLMEELSIRALAEHDTEMRFRMRAARGDAQRGLKVLDKLDRRHAPRVRTSGA